MLSKVSKQPFLKRSQPFPKGCCSIVKMVYISTTFLKGFSLFPKVPIHGITHQAQGKSCPLLTRDVTKSSIWALLFWHSLLDLPPGEIENTSCDILDTLSSLAKHRKALGFKKINSQLGAERCGTYAQHETTASLLQGPIPSKSCKYPRTLVQRSWHPCLQLQLGSHELCCKLPQAVACPAKHQACKIHARYPSSGGICTPASKKAESAWIHCLSLTVQGCSMWLLWVDKHGKL